MKEKVIVDARSLVENPAGVARYIIELTSALSKNDIEIVLLSNKPIYLPSKLIRKNVTTKVFPFGRYIPGTLLILLFSKLIFLNQRCVFWGGNHAVPLWGFRSVLTLHDIVAVRFGSTMTLRNRIMNIISLKMSIAKCNVLTSVSEFTKNEVINHLWAGKKKKQISIIRNSVHREKFTNCSSGLNKEKIGFLLAVGTLEPRKNLIELIKAFKVIKDNGSYKGRLKLIGASGWKSNALTEIIDKFGLKESIDITGFVNDESLNQYYQTCDAFVFPSLYEGFGIPPLEAICCGAKVLCTTESEIPNLGISGVDYFNPKKDDLAEKITALLSRPKVEMNYEDTWENNGDMLLSKLKSLSIEQ